jgi:hypothetical protein
VQAKVEAKQMNTQTEQSDSSYLTAAFAVTYSVIAAELLDINRIPRALVHRNYAVFEAIFVLALWLCTVGAIQLQASFRQRFAIAFLGWGLAGGLASGVIATLGLFCVSFFSRTHISDYLFSWQGLADFLWAATIISFGWFIGVISGAARFLLVTRRKNWLVGFAACCILVRSAVLIVHMVRHQPLW